MWSETIRKEKKNLVTCSKMGYGKRRQGEKY